VNTSCKNRAGKVSLVTDPKAKHTEEVTTELASDRPIEFKEQDRLGRTAFASQLSTAITNWKENDSLVVALYGEWGIGKSSIKNLVLENLRSKTHGALDVIQFNPWQWTGHENLSAAFFREVLAALSRKRNNQEVVRSLRRYAAYLGAFNVLLGGPKGFVPLALGLFGVFSVVPPLFFTSEHAVIFSKVLGLTALGIAALMRWGEQFLEKLAAWRDLTDPASRSLNERKRDVVEAVKRRGKTTLVVIDDVDRLTASEIQAVFQLIKVNADFPRFVYLVLFQRNIVERALADLTKESGSEFLEKLVQVGFDVPPARQDEIDELLFEGIGRVLGDRASERVNQTYWGNIYYGSLRRYFRDLRDTKRFLGSLEFHVNLLRHGGALDVNPVDLISIEALRVFEPSLYRKVRDSKALLTNLRSRDTTDKKGAAADIKGLLSDLPVERVEVATELLKNLFPSAAFAFGGPTYSAETRAGWDRDLRVCAAEFFDRYFQLGISKGEISQYEVELLLASSSDTATLTNELERLTTEGKLVAALDRLDVNKEKIQSASAVSALTALFDIGERLPEPQPGAVLGGPDWTICRIAYHVLKRNQESERVAKLEAILKASVGLHVPVMFIGVNSNPQNREQTPDAILIPDYAVPGLQAVCVGKLRSAALEGRLLERSDLAYLLFRWRDWGGGTESQHWSTNIAKGSSEGAVAFLRGFLHKGTSQTIGDHVARINYFMKYSEIEHFVDLDILAQQIDKLSEARLSESDRRVVHEFRRALSRKRSGKVEGDFGWDSE
jgi:predicted KAP-like P-loop ATPase